MGDNCARQHTRFDDGGCSGFHLVQSELRLQPIASNERVFEGVVASTHIFEFASLDVGQCCDIQHSCRDLNIFGECTLVACRYCAYYPKLLPRVLIRGWCGFATTFGLASFRHRPTACLLYRSCRCVRNSEQHAVRSHCNDHRRLRMSM